MNSTLRAGVVGAGVFGRHHARKLQADPRVELVGVYDAAFERAQTVAEELGVSAFPRIDALIEAVDALTIASPAVTHANLARPALTAGKHVLIEKPIAVSDLDAEALVALAEARSLVLAIGHQERQVFAAMGLYSAPERPTLIESVRLGPWTGRCTDVSVTLDLMTHDLDLALSLMGEAPASVAAQGEALQGPSADRIDAQLGFGGGAQARFSASRIAETRDRRMRIVYPSGEVRIDFLARSFENATPFALNPDFAESETGRDPLGGYVSRVIDAVTGASSRPAFSGREGREVLGLALQVDRAAGLPSIS